VDVRRIGPPIPPAGRTVPAMTSTVRRSVEVAAPADQVWQLISDLPGMGRFSPENTGGRWTRGDGPVVGAVFRGTNARGRRRWFAASERS
jgi:hypothetical protein